MDQATINRDLGARMEDLTKSLTATNLQMARMEQLLSTYNRLGERVDKCEEDILVIQIQQKERDGLKSHVRDWGSWIVAGTALVVAWLRNHSGF